MIAVLLVVIILIMIGGDTMGKWAGWFIWAYIGAACLLKLING